MIVILTFCFILCDNINVIGLPNNVNNNVLPTWDELDNRPLPQWYDSAKIGIFIHWGLYSVPCFKDELFWFHWQSGDEEVDRYMRKQYSKVLAYEDFAPMFKAEKFDPEQWAQLFLDSGARYVVLTAKHKDGYALFPTNRTKFNSVDIGPNKDIVGILSNSIRQKGMKFGIHYSLMEWFNDLHLKELNTQDSSTVYTDTVVLPDIKLLVNNYKPSVLWLNGDQYARCGYWKSQELLAWLYNESPVKDEIVVNDRLSTCARGQHGDFYIYGYEKLMPHKWENAFSLDKLSWGCRKNIKPKKDILSIEELLTKLVATVSCGGNVLINVGPTENGIIGPEFSKLLLRLGHWLELNGEAIYDTSPWLYQQDSFNRNVWYTCVKKEYVKDEDIVHSINVVYAIMLAWPLDNMLKIGDLTTYVMEEEIKIHLIKPSRDFEISRKNNEKTPKQQYHAVRYRISNDTVDIDLPRFKNRMRAWVLKVEFKDE